MRFSHGEVRRHPVETLRLVGIDLTLALHQQTHRHRLHTPGRERRLHPPPEDGRHLEPHQSIQDPTCLLRVYQTLIDGARIRYGMLYGLAGNLVKDNPMRRLWREPQHHGQVPGNGLPLTVLIGCEPHLVAPRDGCPKILHHLLLPLRDHIIGLKHVLDVDAQIVFREVAHMPKARKHLEVVSQETLYSSRLGRRLHYHQIFHDPPV